MTTQFNFDFDSGKCYRLETFYRLCGHNETSYFHTDLCGDALASNLRPVRVAGYSFCWCPIPLGIHYAYCVGQCEMCQRHEFGRDYRRAQEPWRTVQTGEDSNIDGYVRQYTPQQIRQRALAARQSVEEQDRPTRTERLDQERAEADRRRRREWQWNRDFVQHLARTAGQVWVLDLKDDFSRPRAAHDLLELAPRADVDTVVDCIICAGDLSEPSDFAEGGPAFAVCLRDRCTCKPYRIYHHTCIFTSLVNIAPRCSFCNYRHSFVLKNGFDNPKYRWVRHERQGADVPRHGMRLVAGYISVEQATDPDGTNFVFNDEEDRWGDKESVP
ncbi:hypothetical protein V8E51_014389 [Hyaloscypha variabilis]